MFDFTKLMARTTGSIIAVSNSTLTSAQRLQAPEAYRGTYLLDTPLKSQNGHKIRPESSISKSILSIENSKTLLEKMKRAGIDITICKKRLEELTEKQERKFAKKSRSVNFRKL